MRLAIASPNRDKYSETFIQIQMDRLPSALRIFGRPVATETDPGGPMSWRSVRGLVDFAAHSIRHGLGGFRCALQAEELKRRLRRQGIDVLLANYGPTGVVLQPICSALSIPLVVHFHGYDAHSNAVMTANVEAYRELGRCAATVVVVSEFMAERLEAAGIPGSKIRLVRYGVEPRRFEVGAQSPDRPVFLAVGRFVDKKAPNLTVMAFKEVHGRLPKARMVFVGDGVLLESTQNLALALGLGDAVEFPGRLSNAEVTERMRGATVFVQHSLTPRVGPAAGDCEGTPVAVIEAMMSGVPVVATRHAGIGEIITHGRNGYLVEERDVAAMSDAMIRLAESPETAKAMGRAGQLEAMEHYSAESYVDRLQRILESAARREDPGICLESEFEPGLSRSRAESFWA